MKKRSDRVCGSKLAGASFGIWMLVPASALLGGCASPGQPKPPSLQLPQVVKDLTAARVGSDVRLRWTTPSLTTDNLPAPRSMSAVLCRQVGVASTSDHGRCSVVARLAVRPGGAEAQDSLPAALLAGPAGLLAYRVEIANGAGRSAGRSAEAFAAFGTAPAAVAGLTAASTRNGVRLNWSRDSAAGGVELDRVEPAAMGAVQQPRRSMELAGGGGKTGAEVHLSASSPGQPDPGGAIDRTAQKGAVYRYTAQRVEISVVAGHTLATRGVPSAAAMVTVLDTFPPQAPAGLEAAAGAGEGPSIDLSWRPGSEADLAGYNVYRMDGGAWHRLNAAPVPVPGYSDRTVQRGGRYTYRVTSVDGNGNESAAGAEVQEEARSL